MKRIIMFVLLFAALKVAGQTTGYLRFDTVKIMKQNGTCELYVINKTKDSLGLLTNVGGGLTQFKKSKMLNDSVLIIGLDTLTIHGTGGGTNLANASLTADNDYTHNWQNHILKFDSTRYTEFNSYRPDPLLVAGNIFRSKFYLDSTVNGRPFSLSWALRNGANDGDSIRGVLETNESTTTILNSGDNGNQFGNWQFIGNSNNPRLTGTLFGDLKSSSYSLGHITSLNPSDSVRLKAIPAATATKILGLRAGSSDVYTAVAIDPPSTTTASNGLTKVADDIKLGGYLTGATRISGGTSGYNFQLDSCISITLFSGLEYISSGIGSFIQMSDSVMSLGSTSATDFSSFTFSPTRIKFTPADGAGNIGDVWTNTGSGYGHWAAGGSGGVVDTIQVHTSGTTVTVSTGVNILYIDPASTLATLTITLPATPNHRGTLDIFFGGTLTSGNVVTAITISPNSGQTKLEASTPGYVEAGEHISYQYRVSNTKWYRKH